MWNSKCSVSPLCLERLSKVSEKMPHGSPEIAHQRLYKQTLGSGAMHSFLYEKPFPLINIIGSLLHNANVSIQVKFKISWKNVTEIIGWFFGLFSSAISGTVCIDPFMSLPSGLKTPNYANSLSRKCGGFPYPSILTSPFHTWHSHCIMLYFNYIKSCNCKNLTAPWK